MNDRLRSPGCRTALAGLALATVSVGALMSWGSGDQSATRIRNALLAVPGEAAQFQWLPDAAPKRFRQETAPAPAMLQESVAAVHEAMPTPARDWDLGRRLAAQLGGAGGDASGLKTDTATALARITEGSGGYCSDYTQVLNGLAHAAGLSVREWGMSFGDYSGDGHAFSELFVQEFGHWVFLDSFYGFWVRDRGTGAPLSVLEFRERLLRPRGQEGVEPVPLRAGGHAFDSDRRLLDYYRRGTDRMFLYLGNDVFSYDAHPLVRALRPAPSSVEQLAAILLGVHPKILLLRTQTNGRAIDALQGLRRRVMAALAGSGLGAITFLMGACFCARRSSGPTRSANGREQTVSCG